MTKPLVSGLHHVSILVQSTAISLAFYEGVLGLEVDEARPAMRSGGAWLNVPGGRQIHLLELDHPDPVAWRPDHAGRDRHFALQVECLEALQFCLQQAGVPFTRSASGRMAIFCRDPDGNGLEFMPVG